MAPGQELPVITNEEPETIQHLEWGLVPSWADDDSGGLINARAESVDEKPSFQAAYERRRCLVPADGFYEWVETDDGTQPHRVTFADDRVFAMAGLWERWEPETTQTGLGAFGGGVDDETEAGPLETFTVITTEPNDLVADLHHRMAVILDPAAAERRVAGRRGSGGPARAVSGRRDAGVPGVDCGERSVDGRAVAGRPARVRVVTRFGL